MGVLLRFLPIFLYWLYSKIGLNFYIAILLTILFSGLLGYLLNKYFYKPFRAKKLALQYYWFQVSRF